jgi:protein-tyrosine phosphatase
MSTGQLKVRTSTSDPLRIDWLKAPASGVGMTFAPGMKSSSSTGPPWDRDLDADLHALVVEAAGVLVCLLEDHELRRYQIVDLVERADAHGLEVLRLPIRDTSVPDDLPSVDALLDQVEARVRGGKRVVVHCRGGLGRTGVIAGCWLVRQGVSAADALAMLREVRRSERCPENEEQRRFVRSYAERLRGRPGAPGASRSNEAAAHHGPPPVGAWYATLLAGVGAGGQIKHAAITGPGRRSKAEIADLLAQIERTVEASPQSCFSFDTADGTATLSAAGRNYRAGKFELASIGALRKRLAARRRAATGRVRLSALHGAHPLSDVGTLQATAPAGTLFQVASQFNCLEAPNPCIVPVREYVHDNTQGPRASVSAFPGTFLRPRARTWGWPPRADGRRMPRPSGRRGEAASRRGPRRLPPDGKRARSGWPGRGAGRELRPDSRGSP